MTSLATRDTLFDKAAEMSVIGCVLVESSALADVACVVKPADFYLESCRFGFEAALQMGRDGKAIDPLTLEAELTRRGHWAETGSSFLSECVTATPIYTHAGSYAAIVADLAKRRKALDLSTSLAKAALSGDGLFSAELSLTAATLSTLSKSQSKSPDTWQPFGLADAYEPRPPVQYAVAGLLELPSLVIVYGAPGTLKSFWLADLAVCVAAGLPFMESLPGEPDVSRQTLQSPVVWCDFDNGRRRTLERFDALGKARHIPYDAPLYIFSMPSPWLDAAEPDSIGDLSDRVKALGALLVIVDNLGTVCGGADENSADMIKVLSNFRQLSEYTGAVVVPVHHQRKANGYTGRAGDTLRGHSSIEAALDLALLVEREERSSHVTIKSTKTRGVDVPPFGCQFTFEHDDAGDLAEARFWGEVIEDLNSDKAIEDAILDVVSEHRPISQSKLWKEVKNTLPDVGQHRIRKVANGMAAGRKLLSTGGAHGAVLYDLP